MNKVILIGRLGRAPQLRTTDDGTPVCNLRMATTKKWTDNGGTRRERTEWHDVTVWGRQAQNCARYLNTGSQVGVEGELQSREWQSDDGESRRSWYVNAKSVEFLSSNNNASTPPAAANGGWESDPVEPDPDDDDDPIPF